MRLRPAYPYFGSKAAVAPIIWDAVGNVPNWIEAFAGSAAVTLARPHAGKVETLNDLHGAIPNFLRAVRFDPDAVAYHATWPVSELDMHARHRWLVEAMDAAWVERLREDPEYYDAKIAGWWVWGAACWIGSGWCDGARTQSRQLPHLGGGDPSHPSKSGGMGINREKISKKKIPRLRGRDGQAQTGVGLFRAEMSRQMPYLNNGAKLSKQTPHLSGSDGSGVGYGRGIFATGRRENLAAYFQQLANRIALVRIVCGDWKRVCTPAVTVSHGLTGVLLDPPYRSKNRARVYAQDDFEIGAEVAQWAREHGEDPRMRIVLCGFEGDYDMPEGWRVIAWKSRGGYGRGKNENATRERLWLSPHCLGGAETQGSLFGEGAA